MKKSIPIGFVLFFCVFYVHSLDFRSYTTVGDDLTLGDSGVENQRIYLEEAASFHWSPEITWLLKAYGDLNGGAFKAGGGGGAIFPHLPGMYSEVSAQVFRNYEDGLMVSAYADLNYETANLYGLLSLRADITDTILWMAALGGRFYLLPQMHLWARYSLAIDPYKVEHGIWTQLEFLVNDAWKLSVGATGEYNPAGTGLASIGGIAGASWILSPELSFRFNGGARLEDEEGIIFISLTAVVRG